MSVPLISNQNAAIGRGLGPANLCGDGGEHRRRCLQFHQMRVRAIVVVGSHLAFPFPLPRPSFAVANMLWYEKISSSMILAGAVIMFLSSAITSYANILMKMDALQLRDEPRPRFIMARRLVLIAVSLYVVGGVADLVSLGLVPLSLRACASCLTIPFNAVFAKTSLHESLSSTQIIGSAITVFSCIVAMLFAAKQEDSELAIDASTSRNIFSSNLLHFTAFTLPLDMICVVVVYRSLPNVGTHVSLPTYRSAAHRLATLACATFAASYQTAWTNFFLKCIAVIAQDTFADVTLWVLVGAVGLSAIGQMALMSSIMRLFDAVVVIPPYQIAITVWLIVFSAVAFNEHVENLVGFVAALAFSFAGIVLVALPGRSRNTEAQEPLVVTDERI